MTKSSCHNRELPHQVEQIFGRRSFLAASAGAITLAAAGRLSTEAFGQMKLERAATKGRIRHSVCAWCFTGSFSPKPMSLEELCQVAAAIGIESVELVEPQEWPILKKYGLICALTPSHGFVDGWNRRENWSMCREKIMAAVDACAEAGFPNVITFSGFRKGMPDDVGLENCVAGLKTVVGYAEKKKVTLIFEMLNSRVDVEMKGHPDYMGDSMEWCVEVCKRVGSPRLKVLFDVYHVQIMQGDIITRIRQFAEYIGHYHVAGVPGRHELDENQELNYPAIMRAIAETKYNGFVAQEFIPTRDPVKSLWEAVKLCDV